MTTDAVRPPAGGAGVPVEIRAPAKLTLSLRIVGVRPDGYHLLESEMVSLDLADTLRVSEGGGLTVTMASDRPRAGERGKSDRPPVPVGPDNLVSRALRAVGRQARVDLVKRIPPGAGLGGGSADAAAVLHWAGCHDRDMAAALGADVPFCLRGGRAMVGGIGEVVDPLPYEERAFTLLLLPFGMDTSAVYRAWDRIAGSGSETGSLSTTRTVSATGSPAAGVTASPAAGGTEGGNDLEMAAVRTDPRLADWKRAFAEASGRVPRLAGSGSTWFVEGTPDELGLADRVVQVGGESGPLIEVRTVPPR